MPRPSADRGSDTTPAPAGGQDTGDAVLELAPGGAIRRGNPAANRLFGLGGRGASIFSLLTTTAEEDHLGDAMLAAAQASGAVPFQVALTDGAGRQYRAWAALEALRSDSEGLTGFVLRVEAPDQARTAATAEARTTPAAAPPAPPSRLGLIRVDGTGRVSHVNDAVAALLGPARAGALQGRDARDIPGAQAADLGRRLRGDYGRVTAVAVPIDRSGGSRRVEFIVLTDARDARTLAALAAVGDGESAGRLGPATIILREVDLPLGPALAEAHVEALASLSAMESADAIVGVTAENVIVFWNRAARRVFGYTEREAVGLDAGVLLPPGEACAEEASGIARELARGETVRRLRTRRMHKSGRPVDVLLTQAPLPASPGNEGGHVILATDVSAQRALEERVEEAERLRDAGRQASTFAHEIRNPLNAAILNVEMLREEFQSGAIGLDPDADTIGRLLQRTLAELRDLAEATSGFLTLARGPAGGRRPVDINALITDLVAFLETELHGRGVTRALDLDPEVPPVDLDVLAVKRSLINLIRNALEAMETGGVLRVQTAAGPAHLTVIVSDTGAGMSESQVRRIFEPYYTTKRLGTGLGLSYVQKTVRDHGGEIRCRTKPGEGTEFTIVLPVAGEASPDPAAAAGSDHVEGARHARDDTPRGGTDPRRRG